MLCAFGDVFEMEGYSGSELSPRESSGGFQMSLILTYCHASSTWRVKLPAVVGVDMWILLKDRLWLSLPGQSQRQKRIVRIFVQGRTTNHLNQVDRLPPNARLA